MRPTTRLGECCDQSQVRLPPNEAQSGSARPYLLSPFCLTTRKSVHRMEAQNNGARSVAIAT
jgi:hypothetical protein